MSRSERLLAALWLVGLGGLVAGCGATQGGTAATNGRSPYSASTAAGNQSGQAGAGGAPAVASEKPLAFVAGDAVTWSDLATPLAEAQGGQVLGELVLERQVRRELSVRGLNISDEQIEAERQILLQSLSTDPDQAHRLLGELRDRRGLGDYRWKQSLFTRAALRALVQNEVEVTDVALRAAFELRYGPAYEARLIVTGTAAQAGDIAHRAAQGESFIDLAIAHSTDSSSAQGGLIPPISPADTTYPQAIRDAVQRLQVGQVSDPIMLEQGFAVLKLERKIDGQAVQFDDVKGDLSQLVRRDAEQRLMNQLSRRLVQDAGVTVLDPALAESWKSQLKRP